MLENSDSELHIVERSQQNISAHHSGTAAHPYEGLHINLRHNGGLTYRSAKEVTAEKDEFQHQQMELEKMCNPIITKLMSAGGMPEGMPGGFQGPGGALSGGGSSGPTIEVVD
ncbi:Heat shock cognate 71 kDa protein [Triplophysa tibetana]|uniref:Heat shock cognate 71 kDa protein n=1 Tax=Triplophysa tibetana TaxID=1572043 RepID=A0A5A9MY16_9TELE|nr:Heat shock cognate 71 kDa protein [Triplophysa tibetana]